MGTEDWRNFASNMEMDNIIYQTVRRALQKFCLPGTRQTPGFADTFDTKSKLHFPGSVSWIQHITSKEQRKQFFGIGRPQGSFATWQEVYDTFDNCEWVLQCLDLDEQPPYIKNLRQRTVRTIQKSKMSLPWKRGRERVPTTPKCNYVKQLSSITELDEDDDSGETTNIVDNIVFKTVRTAMRNYMWNTDSDKPKRYKCTICQSKSSYFPGSKDWIEHVARKTHIQRITTETEIDEDVVLAQLYETLHRCKVLLQNIDLEGEPFQIKNLRTSTVKVIHNIETSLLFGTKEESRCLTDECCKIIQHATGKKSSDLAEDFSRPVTMTLEYERKELMDVFSVVKTKLNTDKWLHEDILGNLKCLACEDFVPSSSSDLISHILSEHHILMLSRRLRVSEKDVLYNLHRELFLCGKHLEEISSNRRDTTASRNDALTAVQTALKFVLRVCKERKSLHVLSLKILNIFCKSEYCLAFSEDKFSCIACKSKIRAAKLSGVIGHVTNINHIKKICDNSSLSLEDTIQSLCVDLDKCKEILGEVGDWFPDLQIQPLLKAVNQANVALKGSVAKMKLNSSKEKIQGAAEEKIECRGGGDADNVCLQIPNKKLNPKNLTWKNAAHTAEDLKKSLQAFANNCCLFMNSPELTTCMTCNERISGPANIIMHVVGETHVQRLLVAKSKSSKKSVFKALFSHLCEFETKLETFKIKYDYSASQLQALLLSVLRKCKEKIVLHKEKFLVVKKSKSVIENKANFYRNLQESSERQKHDENSEYGLPGKGLNLEEISSKESVTEEKVMEETSPQLVAKKDDSLPNKGLNLDESCLKNNEKKFMVERNPQPVAQKHASSHHLPLIECPKWAKNSYLASNLNPDGEIEYKKEDIKIQKFSLQKRESSEKIMRVEKQCFDKSTTPEEIFSEIFTADVHTTDEVAMKDMKAACSTSRKSNQEKVDLPNDDCYLAIQSILSESTWYEINREGLNCIPCKKRFSHSCLEIISHMVGENHLQKLLEKQNLNQRKETIKSFNIELDRLEDKLKDLDQQLFRTITVLRPRIVKRN